MQFKVVDGFGPTLQQEDTATVPDLHTYPGATRRVWALSVQAKADDPERTERPYRVIWLGDDTLRTGGTDRVCSYCDHLGLDVCPGMGAHADVYADRFSLRRKDAVEIGSFMVESALTQRTAINRYIEGVLALRFTAAAAV